MYVYLLEMKWDDTSQGIHLHEDKRWFWAESVDRPRVGVTMGALSIGPGWR